MKLRIHYNPHAIYTHYITKRVFKIFPVKMYLFDEHGTYEFKSDWFSFVNEDYGIIDGKWQLLGYSYEH